VSRQAAAFAFDWLLAAGFLHQGFGNHGRGFDLYAAALALRPRNASALLARATALEFSVLPDGFGGIVVADRDVWELLEPGGDAPSELAYKLANPRSEAPWRRYLLEFLTRQYRSLLELDPALREARLRLGRVLQARGHAAEAEVQLQAVAADAADPFVAAVARLCLARLEVSPGGAARAYRSALEIDPALSPAWLGLSQALHASGEREQALAALERLLSLGDTRALSAWVQYHLGRGRAFPEALDVLRARLTPPR
jgi:tetratricopeptide (TPR) repeat protein